MAWLFGSEWKPDIIINIKVSRLHASVRCDYYMGYNGHANIILFCFMLPVCLAYVGLQMIETLYVHMYVPICVLFICISVFPKIPDADLLQRISGQKVDSLSGLTYTKSILDPPKPAKDPGFNDADDDEDNEEEDTNENDDQPTVRMCVRTYVRICSTIYGYM